MDSRLTPSPIDTAALLGLDVNGIITAAGIVRKGRSPKSAPGMRATADFYAEGLTADGRWTGRVSVHPERIGPAFAALPKKASAKTRRVFFSMIDLFHVDVPFSFIDAVFAEMEARPHIAFQVLTKRAERMAEYARHRAKRAADFPLRQWDDEAQTPSDLRELHAVATGTEYDLAACGARLRYLFPGEVANEEATGADPTCPACCAAITVWPANVWAGVTVEDQRRADERIPHLLQVPAAVHFVSMEPLLGAVDIRRYLKGGTVCACDPSTPAAYRCDPRHPAGYMVRCNAGLRRVRWAILGSESDGPRPGARETQEEWITNLVDQCDAAPRTAVFVKQAAIGGKLCTLPLVDGKVRAEFPEVTP